MPPVTDAPAREPLNTGADTEPLGTDPQETECQSTASSLDSAVRSTSIREDQSTQRPQETSSQLIPSETSSSAPTGITTATCVSCIAYLSLNFTSGTYSGTDSDGEGRDKKARRRNIARKARIKKRWGGETKTLLRRGDGTAPCQVLPYTMRPPYPGPSEVVQWENAPNANVTMAPFYRTATYWAIPTDEPNHGGLGWEYRDTPAVRLPRVPGAPVWQVGGNRRGNRKIVNIDHVYEVSLLDEFFASRITPSFDCTDISRLFDVYDYTHYPDRVGTRLNTIYSQLASYSNPDFLGMDGGLNDLKGNLWNPPSGQPGKLQGMPQVLTKNGEDYLQGLAAITVVMDMVNDPVIRRLFNSTNERIFKAFAGIDEVVRQAARSCPYRDHNNRPMSATWASAYSEWISTKISGQNSLIVTTAGQYSMSVPTVAAAHALPADRSRTESWSTWMSNYNNKYDDINSLTFPAPTTWPAGHLTMRKRDDPARIGSCARVNSTNQSMLAAPGSTVRSASSTVPPSMTLGPINTSIPIASTAAMTSKPLVFGSTSSVPATPLTIPTSTASPSRTNNGDLCGPALQDSSDYPDSCNATVKMAPSPRPPPTASNIKRIARVARARPYGLASLLRFPHRDLRPDGPSGNTEQHLDLEPATT